MEEYLEFIVYSRYIYNIYIFSRKGERVRYTGRKKKNTFARKN
jgi:hypothetical protein